MMLTVTPTEIVEWPSLSSHDLLGRVARVVSELVGAYQELAVAEVEERRSKVHAYNASEEGTVTARDRNASSAALAATLSVFELKGAIAALEVARDLGFLLLRMVASDRA